MLQRPRQSAGSAYVAAASGSVAWKAVSKQATCRTPGRTALTASSAASDFGWWSGARSVRASQSLPHRAVDPDRLAELRAAVDHAVADSVDPPEAADRLLHIVHDVGRVRRRQVRRRCQAVVGLEDTELECCWTPRSRRGRAGRGPSRRPVRQSAALDVGHIQSRISGGSSPCSRVYCARFVRAGRTISWRRRRGRSTRDPAPGRSRPSRGGSGRGR